MEKKLHGLCFSLGDVPVSEKLAALDFTAQRAKWIRMYGVEDHPRYAHGCGLKVAAGAHLTNDPEECAHTMQRLINACNRREVDLAVVGNETLLHGTLSAEDLIGYVKHCRRHVHKRIKVTFAETAKDIIAHPEIIEAADVVGMHHYPFWDGVPIDSALADLILRYKEVKVLAGKKKVIILESGWPTGGTKKYPVENDRAVASVENAKRYWEEFTSWADADKVDYFMFEMWDEPWKEQYEGSCGGKWGRFVWPTLIQKY